MRRQIRKRILDSLHTMKDAQEIAANMLLNGQSADAGSLLFQCQEGAQKIGETIEQSEGEGTGAVSCLETYCEILYQMSQNTDKERIPNYQKQLGDVLQQTEDEVRDHLPQDRLKVVFLPYKASMWDCMESVWEAADADPECEALVVPIPYYEKNAQGSIVRECYEGDMFPKDVPVVHYRAYHLEEEQPDIVYIHNPYDGGNTVTTVHPDYYSSNLKKYTNLLVYIPYYICGNGPLPDCHLSLPAYEYVDYIILQDEEKVQNLADFVPMEKIVVLGTPKADRIRKLSRKKDEILEQEIPQEWREKIRGKKVILYNISVTGLLRNSKYAMDKIRYVLSCFEGRDDVVLWWRPHPLLEATLQSALPALYEEYMEIKHAFAGSRNGILDETGDAGIASVIADAYLGENTSSLMHYFGVQGKPVMYTNWEITEDMKKYRDHLYFITFYQEGHYLYFVPANKGMAHDLYRLDMKKNKVQKMRTLPGSPENVEFCYCGIRKMENCIVLIPHNTEDVYLYDIEKKQAFKIVLSEAANRQQLFDKAVEYGGKLFLLPKNYPAIVRINLKTGEVCEFKECVKSFLTKENETRMFTWAYYTKDSLVYMASCNNSRILIFNLEDGSYMIKAIGNYPYGYGHMLYDGEYFWLGAYGANRVVRWKENTDEVMEYTYPINSEQPMETVYCQLLNMREKILVCYGHDIALNAIDKRTGKCSPYDAAEDILEQMKQESVISWGGFATAGILDDGNAFVFNRRNSTFYTWNMNTNQWKSFPCRMSKKDLLRVEKWRLEKEFLQRAVPYCFYERNVTILQFIDFLVENHLSIFEQKYPCYEGIRQEGSTGTTIHTYIKTYMSSL